MLDVYLPFLVSLMESKWTVRHRMAGQGLVEYALLLLFVVIVVVGMLSAVGRTLCTTLYEKLVNIATWGTGTSVADPCP